MSDEDVVQIDRRSLEILLGLAERRMDDLPPNNWYYNNAGRWHAAIKAAEEALA